ncbi:SCO family protein [halophilic archaeon]|nr:SCO family protein [halophilic archaeon]
MDRRDFLRTTAAGGSTLGVAGCLGLVDSTPNVTLSEPDRDFKSKDVPYPAWGEKIPAASVPAPLENRDVKLRGVNKPSLMTFFYSVCNTVCPVLISTLRNIQTHALNNGYGDKVAFLPITFDPGRDNAARLRQYAKEMNIDYDVGNWHFLRPKSKQRAKRLIQNQYGVQFVRDGEMNGKYMFTHSAMILLVNSDGYVERAYRTRSPNAEKIIADLKKLR